MPPKKQTAADKKRDIEIQRKEVWTIWALIALFWVAFLFQIEYCEFLGDSAREIEELCKGSFKSLTLVRNYGGMVLVIAAIWISKVF